MPNKPRSDQKSKRKTVEAVVVTDSLHFETEYLILRLTDAFRLVQKREQLIRSVLECMKSVVKDNAQMGILRKESALFGIQVDPDKERASAELQQQLAQLKEQQRVLSALISAINAASKLSRTFTPSDFKKVPPDAKEIVFASLQGKAIRFEGMSSYLQEPIETSDPRVVAALARHHMGRAVIVG